MMQGRADIKYLKALASALDDAHRLDARIHLTKGHAEGGMYVQISEALATDMAEKFRAIAVRIGYVCCEHGEVYSEQGSGTPN